MNFFQAQEKARAKTKQLILYFILALIGLYVSIYFLLWGLELLLLPESPHLNRYPSSLPLWQPMLALWVMISTTIIVGVSMLFKIRELSKGGHIIAESLGGHLILAHTTQAQERRLLNIVEEMAIASQRPTPPVYLLEEKSINAFAAGFEPSDQVIGVTQGALDTLTREELQGVIAHEFSHLHHGDTTLNMRLIGLVYGILVISQLGEKVLDSMRHLRIRRSKDSGQAMIVILVFGIGLLVIGSVGAFFGNLIKAAISRQREFLADAFAVQFTRNPAGIAGALQKIGGWSAGSRISSSAAQEVSHLFFGNSHSSFWSSLFQTHPPLEKRIRAIDPQFNGKFRYVEPLPLNLDEKNIIYSLTTEKQHEKPISKLFEKTPTQKGLDLSLDSFWKSWISEPDQSWATLLALLLHRSHPDSSSHDWLQPLLPSTVMSSLQKIIPKIHALSVEESHLIALTSITSLRSLSKDQFKQFSWSLEQIIAHDSEIDLFEYALQKMVRHYLDPYFLGRSSNRIQYKDWASIETSAHILISAFARISKAPSEQIPLLFQKAWLDLALKTSTPLPPESCGLAQIDPALQQLLSTTPEWKKRIIEACHKITQADSQLNTTESSLLLTLQAIFEIEKTH